MPTPKFTHRGTSQVRPDVGSDVVAELDTDDEEALVLTGFPSWVRQQIILAPSATDVAVLFSDAVALQLLADGKVHVRLVAAQGQVQNVRSFGWVGDDAVTTVKTTSILLSNPSASESRRVDVLHVERST